MSLSINNLIGSNSIFGSTSSSSSSSSLFGTSSSNSSGGILGDFASIKNGSYKKLLKAYYAEQSGSSSNAQELTETETKQTNMISSDMASLKSAADALKDNASLFEKKEDGNYDYDAILKAVKSLTDAYNSALDSTSAISITAVDKKMGYTNSMISKNAGLLEEAGIKIEEGKLTVDSEKLKKADISTLKTLFNGTNSIASKLSARAADIYSISQTILGKSTTLYNGSGSYSNSGSSGNMLNTTL